MSIFFSVVIPLYNKEKYIIKTLDSVLCQTHRGFEILIIDDGSTDRSVQLIDEYTDKRIRVISQKNGGVSAARNTGITNSQYDFVALLDADDWWDSEYLENMKNLILKYPTASLYASEYIRVFKGRMMPSMSVLENGADHDLINPLVYGTKNGVLPLHTSSVVIRKSILKRAGMFDNRISYFEDYDLFLRIISFGMLAYGKKGGAYYNIDVNPEDKLTGKLPSMERHFISYTDKMEPFFKDDKLLKHFVDRFTITSLILYHRSGSFREKVRRISASIDPNSYRLKDKFLLSLPSFIANAIVEMKIKINEIFKKDLD
ncbi:glycosyltransferase family 2 protein [Dyadobacter sp. LJ53]|uniref:glycosyltransferase family 2 protein n=1 Tax=Dyadobacter chenwenxiniae TaxID=2906456 RepID=UPI001F42971C|nr:glycosyltransferase family A protein [Dyadobacter chenwenxiniae]MCF0048437.1 glycosyltransferase family 2 protein [Dyadobacter chenwenxiniae]